MSFRSVVFVLLPFLVTLTGCSTEPEVDFDKLDDNYFIHCLLFTGRFGDQTFSQKVYVQRIRHLIDFVFNPDEDQSFGVEGAGVIITGPDSVFHFRDVGSGVYEYAWRDSTSPFKHGERYALEVVFPEGKEARSEIVIPMIHFPEEKDTIWIRPDSITSWTYPEYGGEYPVGVQGPHFQDTVHFEVSEGATGGGYHTYSRYEPADAAIGLYTRHRLFVRADNVESSWIIRTAVDSPSVFMSQFEPESLSLRFGAHLPSSKDLDDMMVGDFWPVENLKEISNIEGAYGIFTSYGASAERSFVFAVHREDTFEPQE